MNSSDYTLKGTESFHTLPVELHLYSIINQQSRVHFILLLKDAAD